MPDCDGAGTAERSYPTSKIGGMAKSRYLASEVRGGSLEEIPYTPSLRPGVAEGRSYPTPLSPRPGVAGGRSYPTPEARGGGREDQSHVQGAVAAWVQEGLEELSHIEGQEGRQ